MSDAHSSSDHPKQLEALATRLEETGCYRVLRRITPQASMVPPPGTPTRQGILLDLETTGLDPEQDEIIEMAMVPFTYGLDGTLYSVGEPFSRLRQPRNPITPAITALTGLTNEMVAGQSIDPAEVATFVQPAALIVAHNALFDRRFAERFSETFVAKPWACSMSEVNWAEEGFEGTRLGYLAMHCGLFFGGHRAFHDCQATLEILARPLPKSGVTGLARLLHNARQATCRIWAVDAPFDLKDRLKARGYRWNGEGRGQPRAWYVDVVETQSETELTFLREQVYAREIDLPLQMITARDRFSVRS
jgi:DNA polymerase-3 subunit epsilon